MITCEPQLFADLFSPQVELHSGQGRFFNRHEKLLLVLCAWVHFDADLILLARNEDVVVSVAHLLATVQQHLSVFGLRRETLSPIE